MRLVYGDQVGLDRAEVAVADMEAYLRQGALPADTEVRAFLENLALDALLHEAGPSNIALMRAATLFDVPAPEPVIEVLAGQVGGSAVRLRGLGLLDPYPDIYDPARTALAASPLATGRAEPLSGQERAAVAAASAGPLFSAWGGAAPKAARGGVLDVQLTRLAVAADDPAITAACAPGAVASLRDGPAAGAFRLGLDAIGLLDRHGRPVPLELLRQTADAAITSGDGAGRRGTTRPGRGTGGSWGEEEGADPLGRARVIAERGRHLITRGQPAQAEQDLRRAHQLFTAAESEDEAAAVMGTIADIAYQRGDYDEALRIRREIELPVYERLGDTRSAAVAWGQIADIAYRRGEYDEALRIRREVQLPVYERLGDTRSTAVTWGNIADIAYQRGDYDEALRIRREVSCRSTSGSGTPGSAAVTWGNIADIAFQRGDYDEALRSAARWSCRSSSGSVTPARPPSPGARSPTSPTSGATRRGPAHPPRDQLPAYERLGDTRSAAVTWGRIADIAYERGEL